MSSNSNSKLNQSIFRTGAIKLIIVFVTILAVYINFFFDSHMGQLLGYSLGQLNGAQVDVIELETNFIGPKISIKQIDFTDKKIPTKNLTSLKELQLVLNGDALLRAKFVIEDLSLQDIALDSQRESPGEVYPEKKSALKASAQDFTKKEINTLKDNNHDNSLGVIISILEGQGVKDISKTIGKNLKTEEKIKALKKDFQQKKNNWEASKNNLSAQINKYNNFKFEKDLKKLINQIKELKRITRPQRIK